MRTSVLVVMVGLPGTGKTTRAKELETELHAVRLTPDEWLRPLFGPEDDPTGRNTIEGRFVAFARRLLELGQSVILDFGLWSRVERDSLHDLAEVGGADFRIEYTSLDPEEQWRRVSNRQRATPPDSYEISREELDSYVSLFTAPTPEELAARSAPSPPADAGSWSNWRAARWPTSED